MNLHLTANKPAALLTAKSPERRQSIVRALKRAAGQSFPPFYSAFRRPALRFAANGAGDSSELRRLIERMKARQGSSWLNIDSRITAEASQALLDFGPRLRELKLDFALPAPGTKAVLPYPGVDLIVTPDLMVSDRRPGSTRVGALRFYTAKESAYELGPVGAQLVAAMQYLWLARVTDPSRTPEPSLCLVLECFQQRVTRSPAPTLQLEETIRRGCADFVRLWHSIDDKEAA